jgi:hypothetical protein
VRQGRVLHTSRGGVDWTGSLWRLQDTQSTACACGWCVEQLPAWQCTTHMRMRWTPCPSGLHFVKQSRRFGGHREPDSLDVAA